ncbi:ventrally expressed gene D protein [Drosophila sechellia]|uniref:GM15908 n=1 Tax=Drosophila sechellia TaxID=7238 RepID=B4I841_DROSE|nr:ventrally expressed gene D protein [Drosophila sechellia]EDW56766.1 GM15908 [Drosophila sechellia]
MIPHCENPFSIEDTYVEEPQFSEQCGHSRCGQPQTAYEVYQRILLRLQAQEHTRSTEANECEIRKKFWIASFTGRTLQYQC